MQCETQKQNRHELHAGQVFPHDLRETDLQKTKQTKCSSPSRADMLKRRSLIYSFYCINSEEHINTNITNKTACLFESNNRAPHAPSVIPNHERKPDDSLISHPLQLFIPFNLRHNHNIPIFIYTPQVKH